MWLCIVKILVAGFLILICFSVCTPDTVSTILGNISSFATSLNIYSVGEGMHCACRAVHKVQVASLNADTVAELLMCITDEIWLKEICVREPAIK